MNRPSAWIWLVVGAVVLYWFVGYHGSVGVDLSGFTMGGKPAFPPATPADGPAASSADATRAQLSLNLPQLTPPTF